MATERIPAEVSSRNESNKELLTFARGMRDLATVIDRLLQGDPDREEQVPPEQPFSESADWQDHLSQFDDKGVL